MSESKTPRTDEIAQRHLAGGDIVTCYHYAIRLANDLETELAAMKRNEYICPKCQLRQDDTHPKGDF